MEAVENKSSSSDARVRTSGSRVVSHRDELVAGRCPADHEARVLSVRRVTRPVSHVHAQDVRQYRSQYGQILVA